MPRTAAPLPRLAWSLTPLVPSVTMEGSGCQRWGATVRPAFFADALLRNTAESRGGGPHVQAGSHGVATVRLAFFDDAFEELCRVSWRRTTRSSWEPWGRHCSACLLADAFLRNCAESRAELLTSVELGTPKFFGHRLRTSMARAKSRG